MTRDEYNAYIQERHMGQDSLYLRIQHNQGLSDLEQTALWHLFGDGCRAPRKNRLERALARVPHIENYGIYNRVHLNDGYSVASYCAGQDYPGEIKTVRELLAP